MLRSMVAWCLSDGWPGSQQWRCLINHENTSFISLNQKLYVKNEKTKLLNENKDLLAQIRKAGFQGKDGTLSLLKKENKELYSQVEKMMNSTEEHLEKIEKLQINNTNLSKELQKLQTQETD